MKEVVKEVFTHFKQAGELLCLLSDGMCSPSQSSLFKGQRPDTNHVWLIIADEYWYQYTTILQSFKENGYISIGMGKIYHVELPSGNKNEKYS